MNRSRWTITALVAFFGVGLSFANAQDTLTILHLNDTHSNLASHGPRAADLAGTRGGIARAATVIGMTRLSDPNVLLLHSGDLFVGDLVFNMTFGVPELQILQTLGLDAMAVGNHEFDLTPVALNEALLAAFGAEPHFPLLSANAALDDAGVEPLRSHIRPHLIKNIGNIKVGIIGLTTPEANIISLPSPVVIDTSIDVVLEHEVTALMTAGTTVNILLSHMGRYYDRMIAASTPYLHVIVGGHDHDLLTEPEPVVNPLGDTTWIVQAGAFYGHIGKLQLTVNGTTVRLLEYQAIALDENIPPVPEIDSVANAVEAMIATSTGLGLDAAVATTDEIKARIVPQLAQHYPPAIVQTIQNDAAGLSELSVALPDAREAMTAVGGLMGLAYRSLTRTDLGLTVGGATAQPLASGHVTGFDLFRMIGYGFNTGNALGFNLATFRITGTDLVAGLEWGLSSIEMNDEYFVLGYPLRYTYDATRPAYQRIDSVWIWGESIDPAATYSVTTNEFVLSVLKDYVAPLIGMTISDAYVYTDTTELQALLWYLTGTTGVSDEQDASGVPEVIVLHQNFPNPFNPTTTIAFGIQEPGSIRLSVYDILGREVAVLADGMRAAGEFRETWNASDVPSGLYVCRLRVSSADGSQRQIARKMLLMK